MSYANAHTFQLDAATERLISSYPKLTAEEAQHLARVGAPLCLAKKLGPCRDFDPY